MRVSTSMIYDAGVSVMNRQTASLLHIQQQMSTGRRIVTPSDDPVSAARALEVEQSKVVAGQHALNQRDAKSALGLEEAQLASAGDLLTRVRELTIQAGNAALSDADRMSISTEVRERFDELLGLANTMDGTGQYLFSGYMGGTKPFSGSVGDGVVYAGDEGQRRLQVSSSRQIEVSDSGRSIFERIENGGASFVTGVGMTNTGTGTIDAGSVTDPAKWKVTANSRNLEVRFWVNAGTTYYDLVDATTEKSLFTNGTSTAGGASNTFTHAYTSGDAITFTDLHDAYGTDADTTNDEDFGARVTISGVPASGDRFTIRPGTQSMFETLSSFIGALERGAASAENRTLYQNDIADTLVNLDRAHDNLLRVRSMIGARFNEVESLESVNSELNLQYQQTLSNLQDLDYNKAISDLTRRQVDLEAAQKSFAQVSKLSLFDYL